MGLTNILHYSGTNISMNRCHKMHWHFLYLLHIICPCSHPPSLTTVKWQYVSYHDLLYKKLENLIQTCSYAHPSNVRSSSKIGVCLKWKQQIFVCTYHKEACMSCELWVSSLTLMPSHTGWLLLIYFSISWRMFFSGCLVDNWSPIHFGLCDLHHPEMQYVGSSRFVTGHFIYIFK